MILPPLLASALMIIAGMWLGAIAYESTAPGATVAVIMTLSIALMMLGALLAVAVLREDP